MTHNELIREGFAWVGVSAQAAGINQLKCADPPVAPSHRGRRPGALRQRCRIPGDSYSYDIFSQAGQAIRDNSASRSSAG